MIWLLELHGFMAAVSVSFLSGMLMDMLLKKLTGSEKVRYVAVLAAAATAIVMGTYGIGLPASCSCRCFYLRQSTTWRPIPYRIMYRC